MHKESWSHVMFLSSFVGTFSGSAVVSPALHSSCPVLCFCLCCFATLLEHRFKNTVHLQTKTVGSTDNKQRCIVVSKVKDEEDFNKKEEDRMAAELVSCFHRLT